MYLRLLSSNRCTLVSLDLYLNFQLPSSNSKLNLLSVLDLGTPISLVPLGLRERERTSPETLLPWCDLYVILTLNLSDPLGLRERAPHLHPAALVWSLLLYTADSHSTTVLSVLLFHRWFSVNYYALWSSLSQLILSKLLWCLNSSCAFPLFTGS